MGQGADVIGPLLPNLLRLALIALVTLVVIEIVAAGGAAALEMLSHPGTLILIGLIWWWKSRGNRLL